MSFLRRLFGKSPPAPPDPASDDYTLQLLNSDWVCSCCGETHHGIMELAAGWPEPWGNDGDDRQHNAMLDTTGDFLSEDFCVMDGQYFMVRSILEIPVHGLDKPWAYGCWSTLSRENFDTYADHFDEDFRTDAVWTGWLCNRLRGYHDGPDPLPVTVHPQRHRQRPHLMVQDADSPLGRAQREGITPDDLLGLFRAYGHGPTVQ